MQIGATKNITSLVRAALALVLACAFATPAPAAATPQAPARLRVVLDPGHGGGDPGAVYGGTAEKDLALQIAGRVADELRSRGIEVVLTRSTDTEVYRGGALRSWSPNAPHSYQVWPDAPKQRLELQSRADRANSSGADLFVSIHCNAASSTAARGIEVFSASNDPLGTAFAGQLVNAMVERTGAPNRGAKKAALYVTRWSNVPAALVECGFMSNPSELALMRSASYQQQLAAGIADGIERFAAAEVVQGFPRLAGSNRYQTAARVSQAVWGPETRTVILASGEDFADSLVAGPLAVSLDAPVLITPAHRLDGAISSELARLSPDSIIIVGGPRAVTETVAVAAAAAAGIPAKSVERIGGENRYEVSAKVAERVNPQATSVVVASGVSWPDALSISASAASRREPIILTHPSGLSEPARRFLGQPGRSITVVGGEAVVPGEVLGELPFTRIAGENRYETNWRVLQQRYSAAQRTRAVIASAESFPDALVVGPYASKQSRPVLLVGKSAMSPEVRPWVYANHLSGVTHTHVVAGGTASLTAYISQMFDKMRMRTFP